MVIFHSYVSLPEGIYKQGLKYWRLRTRRTACLSLSATSGNQFHGSSWLIWAKSNELQDLSELCKLLWILRITLISSVSRPRLTFQDEHASCERLVCCKPANAQIQECKRLHWWIKEKRPTQYVVTLLARRTLQALNQLLSWLVCENEP